MTPDTIIWKSGCVKRWHCSIDRNLRESGDDTASHQWRCAMLLLMLHPLPSAHLISCVLTHDVPEVITGDMPYTAKVGAFGAMMKAIEAKTAAAFALPVASDKDATWLSLVDRLDAYMWMLEHAPYIAATSDWTDARAAIIMSADALGVLDKVEGLI